MTVMRRHQTTTTRTALFREELKYLLGNVHNLNISDASKDVIHELLIEIDHIVGSNI